MEYREVDEPLSYWRLPSGIEIDFVVGDMRIAIEAKSVERIQSDHLKGMRSAVADHPDLQRRIVVCREPRARRTDDGIDVLPYKTFVKRLWRGDLDF